MKTAVVCIFLFVSLLPLAMKPPTSGALSSAIKVPQDYQTIQAAIDAAQPMSMILVSSGVYYENLVIEKSNFSLVGEGSTATYIIGLKNGTIQVSGASNVVIKGFTVVNNASSATGFFPVRLSHSSFVTVEGCSLIAVSLYSGVWLEYSHNNTVKGNSVRNAGDYGVYLFLSSDNIIVDNVVASHTGVLFSTYCERNTVSGNTILTSNRTALYLYACSGNVFFHNSFVGMTKPVFNVNSTNAWNNGFTEGNYWSVYSNGYNQTTGIGLEPYIIVNDTMNQDNYPLRNPYIPGDYNHDGTVNMTDVEITSAAWQSTKSESDYNSHVDINMDGKIDIKDAAMVGANWQKHV